MSDGSSELTVRDSEDFSVLRRVGVTIEGEPVERLNELECDDETGVIWSNVWQTDEILRIEPDTGWVTGLVDASGLLDPAEATNADVLNGIAATPDGTFLITGKWWPWLFEVRFDTPN